MTVTASERVERILSVLPWIVESPGVTLEQVCDRFGMTERDLRSDLDILMYDVGIHPFTPDARVDVILDDDDRIYVHLGDYFRRPLRLTPDEAIVLYAAGTALLDRPDPDPVLARAVAKLVAVLGDGVTEAVDVRLGDADPGVLAEVRAAVADGAQLRIDYYSFNRDERSVRVVDPQRVVADAGHWYLHAWCHTAGGRRAFRVDRIASVERTGEPAPPHPADDADGPARIDVSVGRPVVLVVDRAAEWIVDTFPTTAVDEMDDGRLRVELRVTADPWLQRLLLRLGPGTEASDGSNGADLAPLAADAAARVLHRYR